MKNFKSIEFFPDYCSSGIWITDEGKPDRYHVNVEPQELIEYGINLSDNLRGKIRALNDAYDYFNPQYYDDDNDDIKESDYNFMIKSIEKDFIKEFPQYKNKLLSSCR